MSRRIVAIAAAVLFVGAGIAIGRYLAAGAGAPAAVRSPSAAGRAVAVPARNAGLPPIDCAAERPGLEARLRADPGDAEALILLGFCDVERGDSLAGADRMKEGMLRSENPRDLLRAGLGFQRIAEPALALSAYEKALVGSPDDPEILYRAGVVAFHNLGDRERAIRHWEAYLRAAPDAANAEIIRRAIENIRGRE